jgi:hypothetical protein
LECPIDLTCPIRLSIDTIREFGNAIRLSADTLIVPADRIRKKETFWHVLSTKFVGNRCISRFSL